MKVAVPTDEMSANTAVCVSFGRAPYFLIRDTETGTGAFHTNPAAAATGRTADGRGRYGVEGRRGHGRGQP